MLGGLNGVEMGVVNSDVCVLFENMIGACLLGNFLFAKNIDSAGTPNS